MAVVFKMHLTYRNVLPKATAYALRVRVRGHTAVGNSEMKGSRKETDVILKNVNRRAILYLEENIIASLEANN